MTYPEGKEGTGERGHALHRLCIVRRSTRQSTPSLQSFLTCLGSCDPGVRKTTFLWFTRRDTVPLLVYGISLQVAHHGEDNLGLGWPVFCHLLAE